MKVKVQSIKVSQIAPGAVNVRDPARHSVAGIAELASSITGVGLLQPIGVRPKGKKFELIYGSRRLAAIKSLGWPTIPAVVMGENEDLALAASAVENVQREDLSPLEEAEAYSKLVDPKGLALSYEQAGAFVGRPPSVVAQRVRLLKMSPKWRKAAGDHKSVFSLWPIKHLLLVARLSPDVQEQLFKAYEGPAGSSSVVALGELLSRVKENERELKAFPWELTDKTLKPAPACTGCPRVSTEGDNALLFPELSGKAPRCTDGACYAAKFEAWIDRELNKARDTYTGLRCVYSVLPFNLTSAERAREDRMKSYGLQVGYPGDVPRFFFVPTESAAASPVFVLDGKDAGFIRWVEFETKAKKGRPAAREDSEGETIKPSLAERRDRLEEKRNAAFVVLVRAALDLHVPQLKEFREQPNVQTAHAICSHFDLPEGELREQVEKEYPEPLSWAKQAKKKKAE